MRYRRLLLPGATYFFTLVTYERRKLFNHSDRVALWNQAVSKVQRKRPFEIVAEIILPDHLHTMWSLPEGDADYATRIRLVKTALTKSVTTGAPEDGGSESRMRKGERLVWQRRYWEHAIRNEADLQAHLDYIHYNAVKHGFVCRARDWPYSTFETWVERGVYDPNWGSDEMPKMPDWVGGE